MKILSEPTYCRTWLGFCPKCGVVFTMDKKEVDKIGTKIIEKSWFSKTEKYLQFKCPTSSCNALFNLKD